MTNFTVFHYTHGEKINWTVATAQVEGGGCTTAAQSAAFIQPGESFDTLDLAIQAVETLAAAHEQRYDFWDTTRRVGVQAAKSGRTHDGSPILFSLTRELDIPDCDE